MPSSTTITAAPPRRSLPGPPRGPSLPQGSSGASSARLTSAATTIPPPATPTTMGPSCLRPVRLMARVRPASLRSRKSSCVRRRVDEFRGPITSHFSSKTGTSVSWRSYAARRGGAADLARRRVKHGAAHGRAHVAGSRGRSQHRGIGAASSRVMSLLSRRAWMSAAGCGAAALMVPAWASAQHASMIHPFIGAFRFVGGDEERDVWSASIDDVVAGMSVLTRGIARDRLKETNPIATTLAFLGNDKVLTSSFDARVYTGLFDGTEVMVTTTAGDKMKLE